MALTPARRGPASSLPEREFFGYDRCGAAQLSMLMSIPTIISSGAALLVLAVMFRLLRSENVPPYVIHRVVLGS